jgi:hypothetical protein
MDEVADIDNSLGDLAGDAEAEIGLSYRARTTPTEFAARILRLERHPLHRHRTLGLCDGGDRLVLAGREQGQQGKSGERSQR